MGIGAIIAGSASFIGPGEGVGSNQIVYADKYGGGTYTTRLTIAQEPGPGIPRVVINPLTGDEIGTTTEDQEMPNCVNLESGKIFKADPGYMGYDSEGNRVGLGDIRFNGGGQVIGKSPTVWSYQPGSDPLSKGWKEPYKQQSYVGVDPTRYAAGALVVDSGDYVGGAGMPFLEAVIADTRCLFVGKTACEQARELIVMEGKGEFYGDNLFYMLSPTIYFIGEYNCHPCDLWCCLAGCMFHPEKGLLRIHKPYWRVWAMATFIYDFQEDNQKYESVNSNIVIVRSNFLPVPFDVAYIPPGVSHIRYWSKNEIMFCEPDMEPPCPADCGTEYKIGGDDEFFLRDEVPVPSYLKKKVGEF